ncbi:MAG: hypothetical protein HW421_3740 [Ignavibacteria bacterium]|nr:hypothetical protein [Ignavibacteria bacterium]
MPEIPDKILYSMTKQNSKRINIILLISAVIALQGLISVILTLKSGLGLWGINNEVSWGISISNFVYWIGIGHAGTLISAILFLFRQRWRAPIHRAAETMTLIAIFCAALFPWLHTGRPWFAAYWLFPYLSRMGLWPNYHSPLFWDYLAIGTYFIVSFIFWWLGLAPDLAIIKKTTKSVFVKKISSVFSLGFSGSSKQWASYDKTYTLLAGLITPLVIAVHSIVSYDFAVTWLSGWHNTLFPIYFVAGAIFSGMAMVVILLQITRKILGLEDYIKLEHFDKISKIIIASSLIITYFYLMEAFYSMFGGNDYEKNLFLMKIKGEYAALFWFVFVCNSLIPLLLILQRIRMSLFIILFISIFINIGMWIERFLLVITSQQSGILPSASNGYTPTIVDWSILAGSFGLFFMLYFLFIKFIPVISFRENINIK